MESLNPVVLRERMPGVAQIKDVSKPGKPRVHITFSNGREFLVTWDQRAGRFNITYCCKTDISTDMTTDHGDTLDDVIKYLSWKSIQVLDDRIKWQPIKFV